MNTTGKKYGGRQKGTPNKLTKQARESLTAIIEGELQQLPDRLKSLEAKDRLEILCKLLPYVLPKLRQTEMNVAESEKIREITVSLIDPNEIKRAN